MLLFSRCCDYARACAAFDADAAFDSADVTLMLIISFLRHYFAFAIISMLLLLLR